MCSITDSAHVQLYFESEQQTEIEFARCATYGLVRTLRASLQFPPTPTEGPSKASKFSACSSPAATTTRVSSSQALLIPNCAHSRSMVLPNDVLVSWESLCVSVAVHLGIQEGWQMVSSTEGKQEDEHLAKSRKRNHKRSSGWKLCCLLCRSSLVDITEWPTWWTGMDECSCLEDNEIYIYLTCLCCLFVPGCNCLMAALRLCVSEVQTQCRQAARSTAGAEGSGGSEPFTKLDTRKTLKTQCQYEEN